MNNCDACKSSLTQADIDRGRCPSCGHSLAVPAKPDEASRAADKTWKMGKAAPPPSQPEPKKEEPVVDRSAQTIQAITIQIPDPQGDTAGGSDARGAATVQVPESSTVPPTPAGPDKNRLTATINLGGTAAFAEKSPLTENDLRRIAATIDSGSVPPDLVKHVTMMWSSNVVSSATPETSLKSGGAPMEEDEQRVIPPRAITESADLPSGKADYEVLSKLGEGGMGVVMSARQSSIDRVVAVKKIKPSEAVKAESRQKFVTEATVTGDLEHPNIVPVYDLGKDENGTLFYSMKHVKGTPWDKVIAQKTVQENLEIWMKVCDAVAFAHSRGIIHRDLKPENIMLGGFGEVLVMDWGLALTVGTPSAARAGMAGTPAYMAPEMAVGPMERISFTSDIYLLGAILYEVVAGKRPHTSTSVAACLMAAARNVIQPTDKSGELIDIALKAMATDPADRYDSVSNLQEAYRQYCSHAESISLSMRAEDDLARATAGQEYEYYARSLFGFQEAHALWKDNPRAEQGVQDATLAYAGLALRNGDFDLGAKLLDPNKESHAPLLKQLREGKEELAARVRRLKTARRVGVALVITVLVVVTAAFFLVNNQRQIAEAAKNDAIEQKKEAVAQKKVADQQRDIAKDNEDKANVAKADALAQKQVAVQQRGIAEAQTKIAKDNEDKANVAKADALAQKQVAVQQRGIAEAQTKIAKDNEDKANVAKADALAQKQVAVQQRGIAEAQTKIAKQNEEKANLATQKEEYGAYIARIGLAAAKVEENAFDRALALLDECPPVLRNWEWGRLHYLCTQGSRTVDAIDPVEALAFTHDGTRFASGGWGGTVRIWDTASGRKLIDIHTGGDSVFALAFSPDGKHLAAGTNSRPEYIKVYNATTGELEKGISGHRDAVLSLVYSADGNELLSGSYDNTARIWDVNAGTEVRLLRGHEWWVCSAAFSPDESRIVTACQDGSVMVWDDSSRKTDRQHRNLAPSLTFLGHTGPVFAASFSPDGKQIASAGYDDRILLWKPVADDKGGAVKNSFDVALEGHTAPIDSLQFSADGDTLVTASHDNTVRLWDVKNGKLHETLRGHAGRVRAVAMIPFPSQQVKKDSPAVKSRLISAGHDGHVKIWDLQGYREELVLGADIVHAHEESVLGVSFSPDGHKILSASRDRTARLWDLATGKLLGEFQQGHHYLATTAVFFPDGARFLTAAVDDTARIWDLTTGMQVQTLNGTGVSAAAAISRDGTRIATGSDRRTALIWDARGNRLAETADHHAEVTAVAFSPDGQLLFTGDEQGRCHIWDVSHLKENPEPKLLWEAERHSRSVNAAFFLPDGKRFLTASSDRTVAQWDTETGKELVPLALGHPAAVTALALSPDGHRALTICEDGRVRLWDVATAKQLGDFAMPGETITSVAFSPDGANAVTTSTAASKPIEAGSAQATRAATEALSEVRMWDLKTLKQLPSPGGLDSPFHQFRETSALAWETIYSPNGASLLTVIGNEVRMLSAKSGQEGMAFVPQGAVASARFSPDGRRVVTSSWDNTARIWNITGPRAEVKLVGHSGYVNDAVFSPGGGSFVATAGRDNEAILWDSTTGKLLARFNGEDGHHGPVTSVAFDATAQRLITASQDRTAKIWDMTTHKVLVTLGGPQQGGVKPDAVGPRVHPHTQAILRAEFSPDGTRVLTAGEDNRAILWDAATGAPILQLQGHTAAVTSVCFSIDGKRAITGSRDATAKLWELREDAGKTDAGELLTLKGHSRDVTAVACSKDGQSILSGSLDGTMILWPAASWKVAAAAAQTASLAK